jgi:putative transposase
MTDMGYSGVLWVDEPGGMKMAKRYVLENFKCKYCGGSNIVLYGKYHESQRWFCKDCKRKFAQNMALPRMKSPITHVAASVQQYYDGLSFNEICRNLDLTYGYKPANSTIYRWVDKFTRKAIKDTKDIQPQVGDTFICDETVIKVGGKNYWFWDCIDADTRFLLASRMVSSRGAREARELVEAAAERAGKTPKAIVTDKLKSYLEGIELAFGSDTKHRQGGPFDIENNTNLIERFHGSLKDRTKVLRGLKKPETARLFLEGWLIHYNYYRPHIGLDGKTPASVAKVNYDFKDWLEFVNNSADIAPIDTAEHERQVLTLHHPPEPKGLSASATLGQFTGRKVSVREVSVKPVSQRRYTRQGHRAPKVVDLGGDIVKDRHGRHLRL